jgi:hypothetical protein
VLNIRPWEWGLLEQVELEALIDYIEEKLRD